MITNRMATEALIRLQETVKMDIYRNGRTNDRDRMLELSDIVKEYLDISAHVPFSQNLKSNVCPKCKEKILEVHDNPWKGSYVSCTCGYAGEIN